MKKLTLLLVGLLALALPVSAQEYGLKYTRNVTHLTDKSTHTIVTQNCTLYTLVVNVSSAGTAWSITVQDKTSAGGGPHILFQASSATVGTTTVALPIGLLMTGGIDVITGGTTAGIADVWLAYR